MALEIDKKGLINEFLNNLEIELRSATDNWKIEALSKMRGIKFAYETEAIQAEVDKEIIKKSNEIIVYLKANGVALADSYGVGSLMTSDNPGLQEYMRSGSWNPVRTGKQIVGRPEGSYVDAFGRKRHSSGTMEGRPLENRGNITDTDYYISPSSPSYALQMAEKWLYQTYLPRAYKLAVEKTNFSKYLVES